MTTLELQKHQKIYDAEHWDVNGSELEQARHILLHLMKAVGKLADWCERAEHGAHTSTDQITQEVAPGLQFHALQLANIFERDLEDDYLALLERNIRRRGEV